MVVRWWCNGGAMVVRWWCNGGAMVVRWWCNGGAMVVQWEDRFYKVRTCASGALHDVQMSPVCAVTSCCIGVCVCDAVIPPVVCASHS